MPYGRGTQDLIQAIDREQARFGHKILPVGVATGEKFFSLIPINGSATITYYNTIDGEQITGQQFPDQFYIPGHLINVEVVSGQVFAVTADPDFIENNTP